MILGADMQPVSYVGSTALITGASSGIGAAFSRALAARGANVVLVARREAPLQMLASSLRATHGVDAVVCPTDLSIPGAAASVAGRIAALGLQIDVLVNNAGFATHGNVAEVDPSLLTAQTALHVTTLVELTRSFLPPMLERGSGVICNIASTVAFQPVPMLATYAGTKAFVLSFSEALWKETRPSGVRVLAVCPGVTDTPFFDTVGVNVPAAAFRRRHPDQVVATAMRALDRRSPSVIDGRLNALAAQVSRIFPRRVVLAAAARVVRPRTPGQ